MCEYKKSQILFETNRADNNEISINFVVKYLMTENSCHYSVTFNQIESSKII